VSFDFSVNPANLFLRKIIRRKEISGMVQFYDPGDAAEQAEIESLLRQNGIEYFLKSKDGDGPSEILVAEEDLPQAQKLIDEMNRRR
jgi:hypothetical protein